MSTLNYSWVELVDKPSYSCYANCLGTVLAFDFTWVSRSNKRFVTVTSDVGEVLIQNTAVNVDEILDFNLELEDGTVKAHFLLSFLPNADKNINYLEWKRNMYLTIFTIEKE